MLSMYGNGASSIDVDSLTGGAGLDGLEEGLEGGLGENFEIEGGIGDGLGGACAGAEGGAMREGERVIRMGIMDSHIVFCISDIVVMCT